MRRFFLVPVLVFLPLCAHACINDRDSDALVIQNKRLPDAIRVISGRFERNPPRFYQMRIARVQQELKANPRNFGLYDDLAVAHDRLGDDETAMRVMAQKRALLPPFNAKDKANKEAWYRYYANDGTFRAHHFLHEGANIERIIELKQGRAKIARAIEIKPDAHFGRERVQLMVMDWIIARKQNKTKKTLGEWMEVRDGWHVFYKGEGEKLKYNPKGPAIVVRKGHKGDSPTEIAAKAARRRQTAEGLAGLVVLGAAWNSADVFEALAHALNLKETVALEYMALLRCHELLEDGVKSFAGLSADRIDPERRALPYPILDLEMEGVGINYTNQTTLHQLYPQLRSEADAWNATRTQWMETKFEQGQHPDTAPNFWQGFKESAPPSLDVEWLDARVARERARNSNLMISYLALGSIFLFLTGLTALLVKRNKRARAKTSSA